MDGAVLICEVITMADITYCINANCPFKDCERHLCQLKEENGLVSIAALDGVCRRYISYLVELADNG